MSKHKPTVKSVINIGGNETAGQIEAFAKAATAIFDSAFKNHIESDVLGEAIRGLTAAGAAEVSIRDCNFYSGEDD